MTIFQLTVSNPLFDGQGTSPLTLSWDSAAGQATTISWFGFPVPEGQTQQHWVMDPSSVSRVTAETTRSWVLDLHVVTPGEAGFAALRGRLEPLDASARLAVVFSHSGIAWLAGMGALIPRNLNLISTGCKPSSPSRLRPERSVQRSLGVARRAPRRGDRARRGHSIHAAEATAPQARDRMRITPCDSW